MMTTLPVGKITKKAVWRSHSKFSAILSKIHSYRLPFRRFCPLPHFLSWFKQCVTVISQFCRVSTGRSWLFKSCRVWLNDNANRSYTTVKNWWKNSSNSWRCTTITAHASKCNKMPTGRSRRAYKHNKTTTPLTHTCLSRPKYLAKLASRKEELTKTNMRRCCEPPIKTWEWYRIRIKCSIISMSRNSPILNLVRM